VGIGERLIESVVKSCESGVPDGLLLTASLGSLVLEGGNASSLSGFGGLLLEFGGVFGVGVKSLHQGAVLEGVLLGLVVGADGGLDGAELVLDLVGVNNPGEIGACHHFSLEVVASLLGAGLGEGTEHVVEGGEGIGGENAESSEVTTRGELEEVESVDAAGVNSGEVPGGSLDEGVLISVDKEGSLTHHEAGASVFTLSCSSSLHSHGAEGVLVGTDGLEGCEHSLGGLNVEGVKNEGELGDGIDGVTAGLNEGNAGGGSEGGCNGVSLLVDVDLTVPLSVDLKGGEHARLSAHVTEGSLSGSVGTGTTNSWDSSHSASSSPGLGGVLLTGFVVNGVCLSSVLGHVGVHKLHNIVSDGGSEDSGGGLVLVTGHARLVVVD